MNTTKTLILVDWSNTMYRSWFSSVDKTWVAYARFFDMLRACVHKVKQPNVPIELIFCGESRVPLERKKIDPAYKSNRVPNKNEGFRQYRQGLCDLLQRLNWALISYPGYEADDCIASIVATTCHRCYCETKCTNCHCADGYTTDIVIFSGDRDLQQLLAWDRVTIWREGKRFDRQWFEKEYDIPVADFPIWKALCGDASDNIKGVTGFGPVKARIAINAGSVEEDIWEIAGQQGMEDYIKALQLIELNINLPIRPTDFRQFFKNGYGPISMAELDELSDIDERILLEIKRLLEEMK